VYKKLIVIVLAFIYSGLLAQSSRINGFISDAETGEVLMGANVFLLETGQGMATDRNGYYVLDGINSGDYTFVVSYLGYEEYRENFSFGGADIINRNIDLSPIILESEEVVVEGERIKRKVNIQPGKVNLSPRQIKGFPALAEPDIFRAIQALPGVLTSSEFSTGLIIRGGNTDQNLILLDGITVYNPSHLGGVFSNFIVDAVKDAELIKGGYNAEYGGRLSAVLNVTSREGNRKKFDGSANVSLLSAQTTLEGPFYKGAWLLAGRRTYIDKTLELANDLNLTDAKVPYYFYDIQGHIFSDLSNTDRLSLSFYGGLDDFNFDDLGFRANWGNQTFSLAYRKLFSDLLIGNFLLAASQFKTLFGLGGESGLVNDNNINDQTFAANFTFFQKKDLVWKFGFQGKRLGFIYSSSFGDTTLYDVNRSPYDMAAYLKTKIPVGEKIILEPGFRLNSYSERNLRLFPDFRLGIKYLLTDDRYINFAIGNYHQFIQTVQDDYNPSILDFWVAIDTSVGAGGSQQVVLGYEEYLGSKYKIQVEGYYKDLQNMLTFVETRASTDEVISSESISDNFIPSDGYAYGLEVFTQKLTGKFTGWLAYTYSISRKIIDETAFFTNWDRRHAFNFIGNYRINKKWDINWKWAYQSGQAYTPILGYFLEDLDYGVSGAGTVKFRTIPGSRNSGRYPPFHRLDFSIIRHIQTKRFEKMDFYFQVINAYKRKNIFRYTYNSGSMYNGLDDDGDWVQDKHDTNDNYIPDRGETNVDEPDETRISRNEISIFPLIPTFGVSINF
tara:strand:- start:9787 stop:12138 length:2352 start_codon:yes stop_codon:yes gene_type:complete